MIYYFFYVLGMVRPRELRPDARHQVMARSNHQEMILDANARKAPFPSILKRARESAQPGDCLNGMIGPRLITQATAFSAFSMALRTPSSSFSTSSAAFRF
jgi:hypothetical protein